MERKAPGAMRAGIGRECNSEDSTRLRTDCNRAIEGGRIRWDSQEAAAELGSSRIWRWR